MTDQMGLSQKWGLLGQPASGRLESYPLKGLGHRSLRIALDSDGVRHLLVPMHGKVVDLPTDGSAVRFATRPLRFGDDSGMTLDVLCPDSGVHAEFDLLIADVAGRTTSLESAAMDALDAVERWRRFLALQGKKRMTFVEQMGLMAELAVLDAALLHAPQAVDAWEGPFKAPHDFEFGTGCVEVKAIGADVESVEIHGLHQLTGHHGRSLRLVLVEVIEDPAGHDVLTYATDICQRHNVDLRSQLAALGLEVDGPDDRLTTFATGVVRIVPVTEDVPRLQPTAQTSEQDLSAVRYRIRIAALLPHVTSKDLLALLEEVSVAR